GVEPAPHTPHSIFHPAIGERRGVEPAPHTPYSILHPPSLKQQGATHGFSSHLRIWPSLTATSRCPPGPGDALSAPQRGFPRCAPRLLGVCSTAVRCGQPRCGDGLPGWPRLCERRWLVPYTDRIRQPDPCRVDAGD